MKLTLFLFLLVLPVMAQAPDPKAKFREDEILSTRDGAARVQLTGVLKKRDRAAAQKAPILQGVAAACKGAGLPQFTVTFDAAGNLTLRCFKP